MKSLKAKVQVACMSMLAATSISSAVAAETITLKNGVKIEFISKSGSGIKPSEKATVFVHYEGMKLDGSVFDSSIQRDQPITFPLNRVIPCWTKGLAAAEVGDKIKLTCPSDTAYGSRGAPPRIGPDETLVFNIELFGRVEPGYKF